jgi:hypothetical protein
MDAFDDLEKRYASQTVRLSSPYDGSGLLELAGQKTNVRLASRNYIVDRDPETGWFDLVLERGRQKILLHNAVVNGMESPHPSEWELRIFPNVVVFNAASVLPRKTVRRLTFSADGLEEVFRYDLIEWQSLYEAPKNVLREIKSLRRQGPYLRSHDVFSPCELYLIHNVPTVMRVPVHDRVYEVFLGYRTSERASGGLNIRPIAYATIHYREPVPLDDALDHAWAWRRFFNQLAMQLMRFTSMTCSGRKDRRTPSSPLYLPNLHSEPSLDRDAYFSFSARNVPYGNWKDRKKLGAAMGRWLEADEGRRLFRARLDRVLEESREHSAPRLVAELCNAVDTLAELRQGSSLTKADIAKVATGAKAAAKNASLQIEDERIDGVLSLLRTQSLAHKLKSLASRVGLPNPQNVLRVLQIAQSFRIFDAHGGHWDEMTMPLVAPTLDALKSICVLWDQVTCGMPLKHGERTLLAVTQAQSCIDEVCRRSDQMSANSA